MFIYMLIFMKTIALKFTDLIKPFQNMIFSQIKNNIQKNIRNLTSLQIDQYSKKLWFNFQQNMTKYFNNKIYSILKTIIFLFFLYSKELPMFPIDF